jgi:hypothetical protein
MMMMISKKKRKVTGDGHKPSSEICMISRQRQKMLTKQQPSTTHLLMQSKQPFKG